MDVLLLAALLLVIVMDSINTLRFFSVFGLVQFLALAAVYGLAVVDVWQDENSFGVYPYLMTGWLLFGMVIGLIMDRGQPLTWPHLFGYTMLTLYGFILAGLWRRYGSPLEQHLI